MYLLIIILKKSEFMAAQRARPILLNERFLVLPSSYNHVKISDFDWSDAANVDAADARVEYFQL